MDPHKVLKRWKQLQTDITLSEHLEYSMAFDLYTFRSLYLMLEMFQRNPQVLHQYSPGKNDVIGRYQQHLVLFLQKAELLKYVPQIKKADCLENLEKSFNAFKAYLFKSDDITCSWKAQDPYRIKAEETLEQTILTYEKKMNAYHALMNTCLTEDLLDELNTLLKHRTPHRDKVTIVDNHELSKPLDYTKKNWKEE